MNYFYFKKLDVYNYSKELVKYIYLLLKKFPKEEEYALCNQLRRALISVPSNIAEGFGRASSKEKIHFIDIAYGSLMEVECQIEISAELGYVSYEEQHAVSRQAGGGHRPSSLFFEILNNKEWGQLPMEAINFTPISPPHHHTISTSFLTTSTSHHLTIKSHHQISPPQHLNISTQ